MDAPTRIVALALMLAATARGETLTVCDDQTRGLIPANPPKAGAWVTAFGPAGIASGWVMEDGAFYFPPAAWRFILANGTSKYTVYDSGGNPVDSGTIHTEPC